LRRRLLASYLALTLAVLIVLEVPLALSYGDRVRQQQATTIQRDAFVIANYAEETLEGDGHADVQGFVDQYRRRTGAEAIVLDARGRVVADSAPLVSGSAAVAQRPDVATALRGHMSSGSHTAGALGDPVMYAAVPVMTSGRVVGAVLVTYGADKLDDRIHRYWLLLLLTGLACLAAAALVGVVLSRWVTRPLVPMRDAAVRLGRGDLQARVDVDAGPPEVREVGEAFDEMADRLEELIGAQEAFVADASHQLRTPLAALRLRLENLEAEVEGAEALDDLAGARRETQRLSRLVDGLLLLARADREASVAERRAVDVDAVVDERLDAWRPVAEECGVELIGAPSDLRVRATEDRMAQVLDNLLSNGIDASPPGSSLRVVASSVDHGPVEIHVIDEGEGLDAEQRRHAFDRFWRAERAGAATDDDRPVLGGSGLGLAIVARLVAADGGRVELHEAEHGGIDAVVSYAAADET
jgi:signal transduction histidine kinase